MIIKNSDKQDIISGLLVANQKAHMVETTLRFKGRASEANQISEKTTELSDKIDELLGRVMDEWTGEAEKIDSSISKANASLQKTIRDIQNDLKIAENVVKAVGFVDDVIVIASKIAAAAG